MKGSGAEQIPGAATSARAVRPRLLGHGRQWMAPIVLAAIATLVTARFSVSLSLTEYAVLDTWFRTRPALEPCAPIALVGITREEIEQYTSVRPAECACELIPRSRIGAAVSRLKRAGAQVVAVDLMVSQACTIGKGTPYAHDAPFTEALEMPGATVMAATTSATAGRVRLVRPPKQVLGNSKAVIASPVLVNPHGIVRGVELLQYASPSSQMTKTFHDAVIPIGQEYLSISAACMAAVRGRGEAEPVRLAAEATKFCGAIVPVQNAESIRLQDALMPRAWRRAPGNVTLINWVGPKGSFPLYSIDWVLQSPADTLRAHFADCIVLIGSLEDRAITPLRGLSLPVAPPCVDESTELTMSGIEIHANAIDTLYGARCIKPWRSGAVLCVIFTLSLLTFAAFRYLGIWQAIGGSVAMIALVFAAGWYALNYWCVWLYSVMPAVAVTGSAVVGAVDAYVVARREAADARGRLRQRDLVTRTIAHDLKQPLAAISALAAAIRAQQATGVISPMLIDKIEGQAQRAMGDINELLTVEPNRPLALSPKQFDLAGLVEDLATTFSLRSPAHEMAVAGLDAPVVVRADPGCLARAVSNLLENATKYWPEGGTVQVNLAKHNGTAQLQVKDHGIGIPPAKLETIFEPFERAVTDPRMPGTGIGLFSARRIARAHGGDLVVESRLGAGSTFTLTIPCAEEDTEASTRGGEEK